MLVPEGDAFAAWFDEIWAARENEALPQLLGPLDPGIVVLDQTPFVAQWLEAIGVEPTGNEAIFGSFGVRIAPPNASRDSWAYVTSGMTSPFFSMPGDALDPSAPSALGYELVMFVPAAVGRVDWPIVHLLNCMAYNLVSKRTYSHGHRRPLNEPIDGAQSALRALVFADDPALVFALPSGRGRLLVAVGVTESELEVAKAQGSDGVLARTGRVTDPARGPAI